MNEEWYSYAPDGREVVVQRRGELWLVRCGQAQAQSRKLDMALARAMRPDADVVAHAHLDYPRWIRNAADKIKPER
jgi:hypothetical protein